VRGQGKSIAVTALAVRLDSKDGIVIGSDGAVYDPGNGNLIGECSKVLFVPECDAFVMSRGSAGFIHVLRHNLGFEVGGFDDLMQVTVEASQRALAVYTDQDYEFATTTLIVGGRSKSKGVFEVYRLSSTKRTIRNALTEESELVPPSVITPIDRIWAAPFPDEGLREQFGIHDDLTGYEYVARTICAARHQQDSMTGAGETVPGFSVGCFLQMGSLLPDGFRTSVIHRWPDVLGEPIDPARGEPMPAFLTPE
jgi:hypothetical protein